MHIPTLISRKREGEELSAREISKLIEGFTSGEIPDYQMSAFSMAVFFKKPKPCSWPFAIMMWLPSGAPRTM